MPNYQDKRQMKNDRRDDRMQNVGRMMPEQQMPMNMTVDQIRQMMMEQEMPQAQNLPGGMPMPSMADPRLEALMRMMQNRER